MRPVQPSVVASRHHVMLLATLSSSRVNSVITITGIGDHVRPEWLIRINGIRIRSYAPVMDNRLSHRTVLSGESTLTLM